MVVDTDPALVLAPLEDAGQRRKIDFTFAQIVIAEEKRRMLGACFVHHAVGKLHILSRKRVPLRKLRGGGLIPWSGAHHPV